MNREIKFRAWDKNNNRMVNSDELVFWSGCCYLNPDKTLHQKNKPYSQAKLKGYSVLEKYIMQYTGIKDKNGKEIYEGDVVKNQFGEKEIIEWDNAGFVNFQECAGSSLDEENSEVIGNIYENKENKI